MASWTWEENVGRYRNLTTGRFVSEKQVLSWVSESARSSSIVTDGLSRYLAADQLNVPGWETLMRQEIKDEYVRQYLLGRGGLSQMTQADWGSVGGMIADQYRYLDGFAREVAGGQLSEVT